MPKRGKRAVFGHVGWGQSWCEAEGRLMVAEAGGCGCWLHSPEDNPVSSRPTAPLLSAGFHCPPIWGPHGGGQLEAASSCFVGTVGSGFQALWGVGLSTRRSFLLHNRALWSAVSLHKWPQR